MDICKFIFKIRGYTPVPFALIALIWAELSWSYLVVGVGVAILGELLRIRSIKFAGGATRTRQVGAPELITDGPYGITRNPLYLANMMIYIGFAIGSSSLFPYLPLAILVYFSVQYGLIISLEEETLSGLFDDSYNRYCKSVPRLFPKRLFNEIPTPPRYSLFYALRQERSTLIGFAIAWILLGVRLAVY